MTSPWPAIVFGLAVLLPGHMLADQNDARLDELFLVIQQTEITVEASEAEDRIWEIWLQHDNASTQARLAEGIVEMNANPRDALRTFHQLIEQFPDFAECWNKRATLYYILGDYTASERDIQRTLELEPRHFGALSGLGLINLANGEYVKAKSVFEAVLRIHPHARGARQNIELIDEYFRRRAI
ncbi:MAG: tetratricopeptide repeat protein [Gammaproteobacteria bacterium]|nr:tetratricopeptide repeat protein [Gammaproteobacteria bacterium]